MTDTRPAGGGVSRRCVRCAVCVALALLGGCQGPGGAGPVTYVPLSALQVTGGDGLHPAFDPGVLHYAVRCADGTTLRVSAQA